MWSDSEEDYFSGKEYAYDDSIITINQLAEEYKLFGNSEQVNDGWIPCSERLPKDEELSQRKEVIVQNRCGEIFTAQYTYNCAHTCKKFFVNNCAVPYIIAWQPLPAPYKPKGE